MRALAICLLLALVAAAAPAQVTIQALRGGEVDDRVIDSRRLVGRKVVVTDYMGDFNQNFPELERKRGFRGPYFLRFNLRDSKLRCLVSRYDLKNMQRLDPIRKNDRVTVAGRIEQLAAGMKRFSNPYYVLRVSRIEAGWALAEEHDVFAPFPPDAAHEEAAPHEVAAAPEEYAGEHVQFTDRFSLVSTFFTTYERDLNLDGARALKFYLEDFGVPCYMPNTEANREALAALRSGEAVSVRGRLSVCPVDGDALVLFSVRSIARVP
ncbi:MAG: hypothetical protein PHN82_05525 [bacterium]|nr:hypothetical protein [bacterium]